MAAALKAEHVSGSILSMMDEFDTKFLWLYCLEVLAWNSVSMAELQFFFKGMLNKRNFENTNCCK